MGDKAAYTWYGLSCCLCVVVFVCVGECFCICVGERHAKHFWLGDALKRATFLTLAHGVYATWTFAPASSAYLNAAINPLTKLSSTSPPIRCLWPSFSVAASLPHSFTRFDILKAFLCRMAVCVSDFLRFSLVYGLHGNELLPVFKCE